MDVQTWMLAVSRSDEQATEAALVRAGRAGERPLPLELARGVLQSFRNTRVVMRDGRFQVKDAGAAPEGPPLASVPEVRATVTLWMDQPEPGQFRLDGDSGFRFGAEPGGYGSGSPLAVGTSPAPRNPKNAVTNARLAHDSALQTRVTVQPSGPRFQLPAAASARGTPAEPRVTSADVLESLHRASGLPIVADYYTRLYSAEAAQARGQRLFEALNHLSDAMKLRWRKDGAWLQFRSASYFTDRQKEVPNRLLRRWAAARKEHGALLLDDLIEIARLSDPQLDGREMAEGARLLYGLAEWNLATVRSMRRHLRFLAGLTPVQRPAVTSTSGLAFARLSLTQQQQFITLALGPEAERLPSLDALSGACLRVDYLLPGRFQWAPPVDPDGPDWCRLLPSPARGETREAALQTARRLSHQAEAAQIIPTEMSLTVVYTLGDPEFASPFILRVDIDRGSTHEVPARIRPRS